MLQQRRRSGGNHSNRKAYKHFWSPKREHKPYFRGHMPFKKNTHKNKRTFMDVKCECFRPVQQCAAARSCKYNLIRLWSTRRTPARWSAYQGEPQSEKCDTEGERGLKTDSLHCESMALVVNGELPCYWYWNLYGGSCGAQLQKTC